MSLRSAEEHDMWDDLNIQYEHAYRNNPYKKACVSEAIKLLRPESKILDVGCGTGVPVSQMLADAGMHVHGTDVAPNMIKHAQSRVKGTFEVANMVNYEPKDTYAAVFIIYSQLGLSYSAFHAAMYRLAKSLQPGGLMVIGQSPAQAGKIPEDAPEWDETRTFVDGYNLPFWGEDFLTLMFTREGQKSFLQSMGFQILYDTVDIFQPDNPKCHPETQQYIIAQLPEGTDVSKPKPEPKNGR